MENHKSTIITPQGQKLMSPNQYAARQEVLYPLKVKEEENVMLIFSYVCTHVFMAKYAPMCSWLNTHLYLPSLTISGAGLMSVDSGVHKMQ